MTATPDTHAPLRKRALAFAVDAAVALAPLWIAAPLMLMLGSSDEGGQRLAAVALAPVALALSALTHLAVQTIQAARRQPTLGQRLARIELHSDAGRGRRLARELVARSALWTLIFATGLFPLLLLDGLWCLVDPRGRSLRDRLAGVRVVQRS